LQNVGRKDVNSRAELSKLVSYHLLRYRKLVIYLAIVNLELETDEAGKNGGSTSLCTDRWRDFADFSRRNWKTALCQLNVIREQ
jgi:hypothetical protein